MRAAGFVLVGGHSSRMGRDKALMPLNARTLVEDVAERVRKVAGNVALVGRPDRYRDLEYECLPDIRSGIGPLGGIDAALAARRADLNLILACDMPGVETRWLRELLHCAKETDALCVILRDAEERVHPLCAVYRSACLPRLKRALDERRLRVRDFVDELGAEFLKVRAVVENVNTPEEWERWQWRYVQTMGADAR